MMQEIFERIDNDDLFFWSIVGVLAVFWLLMFLFAERFLKGEKKEKKLCGCASCDKPVDCLTPSLILEEEGLCEECANEELRFVKDHGIRVK